MNKKKYFIPEVEIPDSIEFTESDNLGSVSYDSNDINENTEEENADKVEDIVEYQKKKSVKN